MAKKEKGEAEAKADVNTQAAAETDKAIKKADEGQSGFNLTTFLQGTKEELDKVVWPSRQQLISESLAVIAMVVLSATIISLVDKLFSWVAGKVF